MPFDAVQTMFISEAASFEFEGDLFIMDIGFLRLAARPNVFMASFHAAAKVLQEAHGRRQAELIEFPRAAEH